MQQRWWRDAVVYEVYVRSFADSDGDGTGDLRGVLDHLDHLVDLGVDALWLTPFYPSPMHDHGYDVADHLGVDPVFGDLAAFDRLLHGAHRRGLRVIVDLVPNHTSAEHPWFRAALAELSSPLRARYLFRPSGADGGPPNNWQSVFGGPAWSRDESSGEWYLHLFDASQPDLDWRNPQVHEEFDAILRGWLDRGVDGFRIDVAHGLFKQAALADEPAAEEGGIDAIARSFVWDQPEVVDVYRHWRALTDTYPGDRMMVGEVFLFDVPRIARYVGEDRLHQAFNFTLMRTRWDAAELRVTVEVALEHFSPATWVLSNHDLVRHVTRYGGGALGRRRGLAVTAVLLALPGSVYLYQGEELGLDESDVPADRRQDPIFHRTAGAQNGRDGSRTPMPWTAAGAGHGFTAGEPWLPFGADAAARAVDVQAADPASTLSAYRRLIGLRRELLRGVDDDVRWLAAPPDVLAFRRSSGLVCVLSTATGDVEVPVAGVGEVVVATVAGAALADGVLTLPPEATAWLR